MKRTRVNEEKSLNLNESEANKLNLENRKITLKKIKNSVQGITLIALVVTIIVLLILAGIALNLTIGENGIFSRAEKAANTWRNAETNEQLALGELGEWIGNYLGENGNSGNGNEDEPVNDGDTTAVFAQLYKDETDGSEVLVFTNTDSYRESGLTYETSYDITNEHFYLGDELNPETAYLPPWLQEKDDNFGESYISTKIKKVKIANKIKPKYTSCMFWGLTSLEDIEGLERLNSKETIDMSGMFGYCTKLTRIDLKDFDTGNVNNMAGMFAGCMSLISLDLRDFDTRKVNNMSSMFGACTSLTRLDLSNFDTSNVDNMAGMFIMCMSLTSLELADWDTGRVTNMSGMFQGCTNLTTLNITDWNTNKVVDMSWMFMDNTNLTTINVGQNWTTENADTTGMFQNCGTNHVTQI